MEYSFIPDQIKKLSDSKPLHKGVFLWIFHADKIPPHIGVSSGGKFYSIKSHGRDYGLDVEGVYTLINRKTVSSLLVQIDENIEKDIPDVFSSYKFIPQGSSCLEPINKLLSPKINFSSVGELLNSLHADQKLLAVYGEYLPHGYKGIPVYGRKEIEDRINYLRNVKGR